MPARFRTSSAAQKGVAVPTPSEVVLALGCNLRTYLLVTVAFVAGIFYNTLVFAEFGGRSVIETQSIFASAVVCSTICLA
jgi:hypothetical protein